MGDLSSFQQRFRSDCVAGRVEHLRSNASVTLCSEYVETGTCRDFATCKCAHSMLEFITGSPEVPSSLARVLHSSCSHRRDAQELLVQTEKARAAERQAKRQQKIVEKETRRSERALLQQERLRLQSLVSA